MRTLAPVLSSFLFLLSAARAQDDVLAVERRDDLPRHAAAVRLLRNTRVTVRCEAATTKEICGLLNAATGDKLMFSCRTPTADAAPAVSLQCRATSLWSVLSIVQIQTGQRFVYRSGVVFLVPAEEVKPYLCLGVYDLRAATMTLRNFPGPDLRLPTRDDDRPLFPEPEESEETVSGFTAEGLEQLLRANVQPDSWSRDGVSLNVQNGLFLIRQTPAAHREIDALLIKLGLRSPPRVLRRR
ncbi:MAG: hypothetical protein H6838_05480 [Planctomycetes bacterium]|nr:hypothetical protein [Planctomycetota bacterium]MCB9884922.1 hypothetical protein [Planctomycetota bacterium]